MSRPLPASRLLPPSPGPGSGAVGSCPPSLWSWGPWRHHRTQSSVPGASFLGSGPGPTLLHIRVLMALNPGPPRTDFKQNRGAWAAPAKAEWGSPRPPPHPAMGTSGSPHSPQGPPRALGTEPPRERGGLHPRKADRGLCGMQLSQHGPWRHPTLPLGTADSTPRVQYFGGPLAIRSPAVLR